MTTPNKVPTVYIAVLKQDKTIQVVPVVLENGTEDIETGLTYNKAIAEVAKQGGNPVLALDIEGGELAEAENNPRLQDYKEEFKRIRQEYPNLLF